jgi:hypothetical protein
VIPVERKKACLHFSGEKTVTSFMQLQVSEKTRDKSGLGRLRATRLDGFHGLVWSQGDRISFVKKWPKMWHPHDFFCQILCVAFSWKKGRPKIWAISVLFKKLPSRSIGENMPIRSPCLQLMYAQTCVGNLSIERGLN